MKNFTLLIVSSILALSSCSDNKDVYDSKVVDQIANENVIPNVDIAEVSTFKMTQKYNVPIQAGKVTVITKGNDTLAITDHAITINIPKSASVVNQVSSNAKTRGTAAEDSAIDKIVVQYEDVDSLTGYVPGTALKKEETVMMFEDNPINCDYDYNDVVLLVKTKMTNNKEDGSCIVEVAVKPLAYGAKYNIKFGFDYASVSSTNGNTTKTDRSTGIVLSNNVKRDFFDNREMNTTGTYSPVIPLKDYTIEKPFTSSAFQLGDSIPCIKYDRKSEEQDTNSIVPIDHEGFYQFAPIKVTADSSTIEFFIQPEIPLTYVKTSTLDFKGKTLSGKIKYTSIFSYKLYAGDCDLNASSLIPYGIAIPLSVLNLVKGQENNTFIYWPYESQPIWEGLPSFKNWLNSNNDGSWINDHENVSKDFESGGQKWSASVLVRGASYSEMTLRSENDSLQVVDATQNTLSSKKVNELITNAVQQ